MKKFKGFFLFCAFISLFGVRFFKSIPWVSSLAVTSVLISLFDITSHIWNDNSYQKIKRNGIYIFCLGVSIIIDVLLIMLIIINIVLSLSWMENDLFIDEVTIIALMLNVFQASIISFINFIIQGKKD